MHLFCFLLLLFLEIHMPRFVLMTAKHDFRVNDGGGEGGYCVQ